MCSQTFGVHTDMVKMYSVFDFTNIPNIVSYVVVVKEAVCECVVPPVVPLV